jgi:hypothetical protein
VTADVGFSRNILLLYSGVLTTFVFDAAMPDTVLLQAGRPHDAEHMILSAGC